MLLRTVRLLTASPLLWFGRRGACAVPHPAKAMRGGEDAFFIHPFGIGVADGIGGYADLNIDPSIFPRALMRHTLQALRDDHKEGQEGQGGNRGGVTALDALSRGFAAVQQQRLPGGCPVSLVTIVDGRRASLLNLGDCGTVCLRGAALFFATGPQLHRFNCPFALPGDAPSAGDRTTLEVSAGDVVMCASDGLLDNVEPDDIVAALQAVARDGCQRVAEALAAQACANASDKTFVSPFARAAREYGYKYTGGKPDDVTVVVAQLTTLDEEPNPCPALITELLRIKE